MDDMNLRSIDLHELRSVFPGAESNVDAAVGLDNERSHRRQGGHTVADMRGAKRAAETLERLPDEGESVHILLSGNFRNADFIPAILDMAAPAVAVELWLSTLGYDRATADLLLRELDAGRIGRVSLLASVYFQSHDRQLWDWLAAELERRGSRALAGRNHAKVMAFALSDGRRLAIESSANLRSCRMAELTTITAAAGLCDFHHQWIDDLFEKARTK